MSSTELNENEQNLIRITNLGELEIDHEYFIKEAGFIRKKFLGKYKGPADPESPETLPFPVYGSGPHDMINPQKFVVMRVRGGNRYGELQLFYVDQSSFDSGQIIIFYPRYEEREDAADIRNKEKRAELASKSLPNEANEQLKYEVAEFIGGKMRKRSRRNKRSRSRRNKRSRSRSRRNRCKH